MTTGRINQVTTIRSRRRNAALITKVLRSLAGTFPRLEFIIFFFPLDHKCKTTFPPPKAYWRVQQSTIKPPCSLDLTNFRHVSPCPLKGQKITAFDEDYQQ